MAIYDSIDIDWTWDGDFYVGPDGDLADNKDDFIRSLKNEIQTIVKSDTLDWSHHLNLGATLSDFKGAPNIREVGQAIQERVKSKILDTRIVQSSDLKVRVVPVHIHEVLIVITVNAASTSLNSLAPGEQLTTSVVYNSAENSIFFLPDDKMKLNSTV